MPLFDDIQRRYGHLTPPRSVPLGTADAQRRLLQATGRQSIPRPPPPYPGYPGSVFGRPAGPGKPGYGGFPTNAGGRPAAPAKARFFALGAPAPRDCPTCGKPEAGTELRFKAVSGMPVEVCPHCARDMDFDRRFLIQRSGGV